MGWLTERPRHKATVKTCIRAQLSQTKLTLNCTTSLQMRSTGLISMEFQGTQGNFTDKRYQVRVRINSSEGSNTRETTEGNSIMDPPTHTRNLGRKAIKLARTYYLESWEGHVIGTLVSHITYTWIQPMQRHYRATITMIPKKERKALDLAPPKFSVTTGKPNLYPGLKWPQRWPSPISLLFIHGETGVEKKFDRGRSRL